MNITGGVRLRVRKQTSVKLRKSKKIKVSKKSIKPTLPKTARALSKKSRSFKRLKASRASGIMSLTELQFIAKSRGIPFGGLTKTKLVRKINNYF